MIKSAIYKIKNIKNNKFYIGSSKEIPKRWNRHKNELRDNKHYNIFLQRAWNKYGENNFIFEIIKRCADKNLIKYEQDLLDYYKNTNLLYNISQTASGGDIISFHPERKKVIEKIKIKTQEAMNKLTAAERKQKWGRSGENNPNYGNSWSDEKRKQASKRMKKRFRNPDERRKISESKKAYFNSGPNDKDTLIYERNLETRRKMSEHAKSRIGNKNSFYGKTHSTKTKQMISKKNTGRYLGYQERTVIIDEITYKSVSEAARQLGVCPATILYRIKSSSIKFSNYRYVE